MADQTVCKQCGQEFRPVRWGPAPAPEMCSKCDPRPGQSLAWIEEMEPGSVFAVEDLLPNVTRHDPKRRS